MFGFSVDTAHHTTHRTGQDRTAVRPEMDIDIQPDSSGERSLVSCCISENYSLDQAYLGDL